MTIYGATNNVKVVKSTILCFQHREIKKCLNRLSGDNEDKHESSWKVLDETCLPKEEINDHVIVVFRICYQITLELCYNIVNIAYLSIRFTEVHHISILCKLHDKNWFTGVAYDM